MSDGIRSLSANQYFSSAGCSKSMLDDIAGEPWGGCPALFYAKHIAGTVENKDTEATRFGSLVHRVVLEPDSLTDAYHVKPEGMSFSTKEGKAWKADHSDREIINETDWTKAVAIRDAVWSHPDARRLLEGAQTEQCLFANDENGMLRKCRLDALPAKGNALADLKTAGDVGPRAFEKSVWEYRYFVQAAYYCDLAGLLGIEREAFAFIVVQKEPPFLVSVYQMDPEIMEIGRMMYRRELAEVQRRTEENDWPGYPTQMVGIPDFARKQLEAVL